MVIPCNERLWQIIQSLDIYYSIYSRYNQSIVVLINLSNSVENKHVNRKLQKKGGGISMPLALVVGRRIKYMSALRSNSSTAGFKFSDV